MRLPNGKPRLRVDEKLLTISVNVESMELFFLASHAQREQKSTLLQRASSKLDLLKFFLQISWGIKALDSKKYIALAEILNEIGRMTGGWIKQTEK